MKGRQLWLPAEVAPPLQPGELEEEGFSRGFKSIAGLDEVGRGPLAGPVVAAAVVFPRGLSHPDIRDSKLLTPKKRETMVLWIKTHAEAWAVGIVGPEEIDRTNILRATFLAMSHALKQLRPVPDYLLIDGPHKIPLEFFNDDQKVPEVQNDLKTFRGFEPFPFQRAVKKGDRLCLSIAAASIVAKVTRDKMMMDLDRLYPEYGFAEHKGYSCRLHLAALNRHGPSPIHRRSFKPVREYLTNAQEVSPSSLFRKG
ncbi:MAG: ribonuclease HII [Candidatus Binatia bacterium]